MEPPLRCRPLALVLAAAASAVLLPGASAHADIADVWTTYPSISACKGDLLHLNNFCYGLQDGQAIGLVDASLAVDALDQSLGVFYDDENDLPTPESAVNPVIEVWNNTNLITFITTTGTDGATTYFVRPHADVKGEPVDLNQVIEEYLILYINQNMKSFVQVEVDSSPPQVVNDYATTSPPDIGFFTAARRAVKP
jgi:hypothetical protein